MLYCFFLFFSEIEFFGIKLKKEIEELKEQIRIQFGDLKKDIKNSQVQTIHQHISGFGPPPPDEKLPELNAQVDKIIRDRLKKHGFEENLEAKIDVPADNLFMFQVRYNIENQLRRIWENRFEQFDSENKYNPRHYPVMKIIQDLMKYELLTGDIYKVLRETLSICNYAIHGEEITENQVSFVKRNASEIIDILKHIK